MGFCFFGHSIKQIIVTSYRKIRKRQRLWALLRVVRLPNLVMMVAAQLLVVWFLRDESIALPIDWQKLLLLQLATACSAAGGYIINDYYDVKIDMVNRPARVVVGAYLTRRKALAAHLTLSAIAAAVSALLGLRVFLVVCACTCWLWVYSNRLKRLPLIGNVAVSLLTALAIYLPALIFRLEPHKIIIISTFSFFISLIREIVKDMEDVRGDARHGCKTLPILLGVPATKTWLYAIGAVFVGSIIVSNQWLSTIWMVFSVLFSAALTYFFYLLSLADRRRQFATLSKMCKWLMASGMASIAWM